VASGLFTECSEDITHDLAQSGSDRGRKLDGQGSCNQVAEAVRSPESQNKGFLRRFQHLPAQPAHGVTLSSCLLSERLSTVLCL
jgi:hypothetical protein